MRRFFRIILMKVLRLTILPYRSTDSTHGTELECKTARELIDGLTPVTGDQQKLLDDHLALCPNCAAEAKLEGSLRKVIAPEKLSTPSPGFEAALMAELDLTPVKAPKTYPLVKWAWAAGILASGLLLLLKYNLQPLTLTFYKGGMFFIGKISRMMIYLDGLANQAADGISGQAGGTYGYILGEISRTPQLMNSLILTIMFGSFALLSGLIAVGVVNRK